MATNPETTAEKPKSAAPKRSTRKPATAKATPAKRRAAPRATATKTRGSSPSTVLANVPQWLTVGASITGAAVAIGATLFATRQEWLPRARKLGDWVEKSVNDQLDGLNARGRKNSTPNAADIPVAAPHFEPTSGDAGFAGN